MSKLHAITCFTPNGQITYETCPFCQEPDVKVEHGQETLASDHDGTIKDFRDLGPQHYWHCPECGDSFVIVLDCPLCAPAQISQEVERPGWGE